MKTTTRHLLSLVATAAFVTFAFGSLKPSPEEEKKRAQEQLDNRAVYDDWVKKVGAAYSLVAGMNLAGSPDKACDGPALLKLAKEDYQLRLPTVYGPYLARFASSNPADWKEDKGPWAFLTESTFRGHFEKHASARDAYALDGTARMIKNDWQKFRFLIVLWPEDESANRLPKITDTRTFDSGSFKGWVLLLDPIDKNVACQKRIFVENGETVSSNESFTKNPQKAVQNDFENRFEAAIEGALPPQVKSTNNMGALLK